MEPSLDRLSLVFGGGRSAHSTLDNPDAAGGGQPSKRNRYARTRARAWTKPDRPTHAPAQAYTAGPRSHVHVCIRRTATNHQQLHHHVYVPVSGSANQSPAHVLVSPGRPPSWDPPARMMAWRMTLVFCARIVLLSSFRPTSAVCPSDTRAAHANPRPPDDAIAQVIPFCTLSPERLRWRLRAPWRDSDVRPPDPGIIRPFARAPMDAAAKRPHVPATAGPRLLV